MMVCVGLETNEAVYRLIRTRLIFNISDAEFPNEFKDSHLTKMES